VLVGGLVLAATSREGRAAISAIGDRVVAFARSQRGVPYSFGGGNYYGPTPGLENPTVGYDCSGLSSYAVFNASNGKVKLPRTAQEQFAGGSPVATSELRAGDLLFFDTDGNGGAGHVGVYDGHGGMVHAPHTGTSVQEQPNVFDNTYWAPKFLGARRYS